MRFHNEYNLFSVLESVRAKDILRDMLRVLNPDCTKGHNRSFLIMHPRRVFNALSGREIYIPYADLIVTTVCTLRCQGCGSLMGLYNNPRHIDKEAIIETLVSLFRGGVHFNRIHVLGGEPLCYPFLYDILSFLKDQDKVNKVGITTNGTLTLKDGRIIELLRDRKFRVDISNYGENVSRKTAELVQQLSENGIRYQIRNSGSGWLWVDFGGFDCRHRSREELRSIYCSCLFRRVNSILDKILYHCSREAHGSNLKLLPLGKGDYVDLLQEPKVLRKELRLFLYSDVSAIEACDYCDSIVNPRHINAGVQPQ